MNMISFEETGLILDEIADEMPDDFYRELNGGIILLPETKTHPGNNSIFIMGEYHNDRKGYGGLGRYIAIYYGSFTRLYGHLDRESFKSELRRTLIHEFTHHVESLAGDRSLEIKDAAGMQKYQKYRRKYK